MFLFLLQLGTYSYVRLKCFQLIYERTMNTIWIMDSFEALRLWSRSMGSMYARLSHIRSVLSKIDHN